MCSHMQQNGSTEDQQIISDFMSQENTHDLTYFLARFNCIYLMLKLPILLPSIVKRIRYRKRKEISSSRRNYRSLRDCSLATIIFKDAACISLNSVCMYGICMCSYGYTYVWYINNNIDYRPVHKPSPDKNFNAMGKTATEQNKRQPEKYGGRRKMGIEVSIIFRKRCVLARTAEKLAPSQGHPSIVAHLSIYRIE